METPQKRDLTTADVLNPAERKRERGTEGDRDRGSLKLSSPCSGHSVPRSLGFTRMTAEIFVLARGGSPSKVTPSGFLCVRTHGAAVT